MNRDNDYQLLENKAPAAPDMQRNFIEESRSRIFRREFSNAHENANGTYMISRNPVDDAGCGQQDTGPWLGLNLGCLSFVAGSCAGMQSPAIYILCASACCIQPICISTLVGVNQCGLFAESCIEGNKNTNLAVREQNEQKEIHSAIDNMPEEIDRTITSYLSSF